jgi:spore coat protein A, manganese oxidase
VLSPEGTRPDPDDARTSIPFYRALMRETETQIHRDLPSVRVWSYSGSVPGPTIEAKSGQGLLVEWRNELPKKHFLPVDPRLCGKAEPLPEVRAVVHVHGAKARPESDGYPENWFLPGNSTVSHYPCRQEAALLWYHDHAMGISRLNQYAGLFGLFVIRDEVEDGLALPRGAFEIPLVIFDRLLDENGQLYYPKSNMPEAPWVPEVHGDAILVNGKLYPYLDVEPRAYRFRVVNASNSRFYYLSLSNGGRFSQIGTDQGLLGAPAEIERATVAPAERADLVIDFSAWAGQQIVLKSLAFELMQFRVARGTSAGAVPLPRTLRPVARLEPERAKKTRTLTLNEYQDPKTHMMLMLLNGTRWSAPVTETPELDSIEIWELVNTTEDTHPIHLHLVRFQVLDRQPFDVDEYLASGKMKRLGDRLLPAPEEAGWKDTVRADSGLITRIIIKFEGFEGRYAWHCHVLEHEANEMMRPYQVVARS